MDMTSISTQQNDKNSAPDYNNDQLNVQSLNVAPENSDDTLLPEFSPNAKARVDLEFGQTGEIIPANTDIYVTTTAYEENTLAEITISTGDGITMSFQSSEDLGNYVIFNTADDNPDEHDNDDMVLKETTTKENDDTKNTIDNLAMMIKQLVKENKKSARQVSLLTFTVSRLEKRVGKMPSELNSQAEKLKIRESSILKNQPALSSTRYSTNPISTMDNDTTIRNSAMLNTTVFKQNQKILTNIDKIPKFGTEQRQTVTAFLCHDIAEYAEVNGVEDATCVAKWIHMCFDDIYKLRVKSYTKEIFEDSPEASLTYFLERLAQKLTRRVVRDVDEQTKRRRSSENEGIEDYFLRLRREFSAVKVPESDINQRIIESILQYEDNPRVLTELERYFNVDTTPETMSTRQVDDIARKIDKVSGMGDMSGFSRPSIAVTKADAKQKSTTVVETNEKEKPKLFSKVCNSCGMDHYEVHRSKIHYSFCRNCFLDEFCANNGLPMPRYDQKTGIPMYFCPNRDQWLRRSRENLHALPSSFLRTDRRQDNARSYIPKYLHPDMGRRNRSQQQLRPNNYQYQSSFVRNSVARTPVRYDSNWRQNQPRKSVSWKKPQSYANVARQNTGFGQPPASIRNFNRSER